MRVLLREVRDPDGERHGARGEHIHHAEVAETRLVVQMFVEVAGHPSRGDPGLGFRSAARADDFSGGPHRGGGVRFTELHCYPLMGGGKGPAQTG